MSLTLLSCFTGAGDNFVAGAIHAISLGKGMNDAVLYGLGAAKCAVESEDSLPRDLSSSKLETAYREVSTKDECVAFSMEVPTSKILQAMAVNKDVDNVENSIDNAEALPSTQGGPWSSLASSLLKRQHGVETPTAMEDLNHQISSAMAEDAVREGDSGAGSGLYNLMDDIQRNTDKQVEEFKDYRESSRRGSHFNARYLMARDLPNGDK